MSPRAKSAFYHDLAQLLQSGVTLPQAAGVLGASNAQARKLAAALESGAGVAAAFEAAGFGGIDTALVEAGESTGRLVEVFREMAERYEELAAARARIRKGALYPLFLLHLAAFLLPLPLAVLASSPLVYVTTTATILGITYLLLALAWISWRCLTSAYARSVPAARIILLIPLVGGWLEITTGARFAGVLSMFARSGGGILRGLRLAGVACGSAPLRDAAAQATAFVKSGGALSTGFRGGPGIPSAITRALHVGDQAGRLDEETLRAASTLRAEALSRLDSLVEWTPRLLYLVVALFIAWAILQNVITIYSAFGSVFEGL